MRYSSDDYFNHPSWPDPLHPPTPMFPIQSTTQYASTPPRDALEMPMLLHPNQSRTIDTSARLAVMGLIFCLSLLGILPPRLTFDSLHLTVKSHSCLFPCHLEKVSLFAHPLHHLLCRKALWHRSAHYIMALSIPLIDSFKGVILSTAFVHLLQDAFDRLQDPQVKQYTDIGRWTGLIVQVHPLVESTYIFMIFTVYRPCL